MNTLHQIVDLLDQTNSDHDATKETLHRVRGANEDLNTRHLHDTARIKDLLNEQASLTTENKRLDAVAQSLLDQLKEARDRIAELEVEEPQPVDTPAPWAALA